MKKILISILLVMGLSIPVNASLIDLLNGVIQDDRGTATSNDDTYWIQDLNRFADMTYDEQISAIEGLDNQGVIGIKDFHMASYSDMLSFLDLNSLEEIVAVFTPTPNPPIPNFIKWGGRTNRYYAPGIHYVYLIDIQEIDDDYHGRFIMTWDTTVSFRGAWVVAYRDVGPPIADCGQERAVVFDSIALDGSGSSDPEGQPLLYEWTLQHEGGSIITAYGSNPTISDLPSGFIDVYLTVTDDEGLTDTDNMLLAAAGSCFCTGSTMHIESILAGTSKGKYCKATVTVFDNCGNPVPAAEVTGTFSVSDPDPPFNESGSGLTNANGVAVIYTTSEVKKPSYEFCVNNVVKGTLAYEPNDNVETCETK